MRSPTGDFDLAPPEYSLQLSYDFHFVPRVQVTYLRDPFAATDSDGSSVGRRRGSARSPISSTDEAPQVSYSCVDYSCSDWFADVCQSVFRPNAAVHQPLSDDPGDLMSVDS